MRTRKTFTAVSILVVLLLTVAAAQLPQARYLRWIFRAALHHSGKSSAGPQGNGGNYVFINASGAGTAAFEGTLATSINDASQVTGYYITSGTVFHGFLYESDGTLTDINAPKAGSGKNQGTFPISIDADGNIAGMYADSNNAYHGFVRKGSTGAITDFDAPQAGTTTHRGTIPISINAGAVAGIVKDANDLIHGFWRNASGTVTTTFDAPGAGTGAKQGTSALSINSSGLITGAYSDSNSLYHGFIYNTVTQTFTAPIDAPGAALYTGGIKDFCCGGTYPISIDSAGDIAGIYTDSSGVYHGFVLPAGASTPTDFNVPNTGTPYGTYPLAMNATAGIVGFYSDSDDTSHGFITTTNGTVTNAPLDAPNAGTGTMNGTFAASINDSGIVAGTYGDTNQVYHGFVLTPTASPTISLSPTSLSFGDQAVNTTSAAKTVTVTNTGTATVDLTSVAITAGNSYFAISSDACGATLAAGKNCTVKVTFTPTQLAAETGTLTFTDNASGSPQTVSLSGTGIAQATLTPSSYTFPKTKVGSTSAAKKFTLKNNVSTTLTGLSYSTKAPFAISTSTCTTTLSSKKSCTISVTFSPTVTGTKTGTLTVNDSANNSPQTASLSGTGD